MAASRSLRRLLELLRVQEDQARRGAAAAAETERLLNARARATARERQGRMLVAASAQSGAAADRAAGLEEIRIARRVMEMLAPRIAAAKEEQELRRGEFLAQRTGRRQVETLLAAAEREQARGELRRAQNSADDLHLGRRRGGCKEAGH